MSEFQTVNESELQSIELSESELQSIEGGGFWAVAYLHVTAPVTAAWFLSVGAAQLVS